jgi:hypothetical protein
MRFSMRLRPYPMIPCELESPACNMFAPGAGQGIYDEVILERKNQIILRKSYPD